MIWYIIQSFNQITFSKRDTDRDTWPVYCTAIGGSSGHVIQYQLYYQ